MFIRRKNKLSLGDRSYQFMIKTRETQHGLQTDTIDVLARHSGQPRRARFLATLLFFGQSAPWRTFWGTIGAGQFLQFSRIFFNPRGPSIQFQNLGVYSKHVFENVQTPWKHENAHSLSSMFDSRYLEIAYRSDLLSKMRFRGWKYSSLLPRWEDREKNVTYDFMKKMFVS